MKPLYASLLLADACHCMQNGHQRGMGHIRTVWIKPWTCDGVKSEDTPIKPPLNSTAKNKNPAKNKKSVEPIEEGWEKL